MGAPLADPPRPEAVLDRVLGQRDVIAICIAAIIGVGIFFTPASVVQRTGSGGAALLAWIAGGVVAILGALTFAELGAMMPKVGGQFAVIREAFGQRVAFLSVASVTMAVQCGAIGILALIFGENVLSATGVAPEPVHVMLCAIAAIAIVYAINVAGVRLSANVLAWNVALKLVVVVAIVALAAFAAHPTPPKAFTIDPWPGPSVFVYALIPTLFSYGGFEQILWAAGEIRNPERNVARGILIGVTCVVIAYVALNVSFLTLLGAAGVGKDNLVASRAVEAAAPGYGRLVAVAVAISALGTTHAIMLTSPRQVMALARDGLAPRVLGAVSRRAQTPAAATTFIAALSAVLVVTARMRGLDLLLDALICVNWGFFAVTGAALFVLRRTRPALPRPFRVPGYPVVPGLFVLIAAVAALSPFFQEKGREAAIYAAILVLTLGVASRFWIRRRELPKSWPGRS